MARIFSHKVSNEKLKFHSVELKDLGHKISTNSLTSAQLMSTLITLNPLYHSLIVVSSYLV